LAEYKLQVHCVYEVRIPATDVVSNKYTIVKFETMLTKYFGFNFCNDKKKNLFGKLNQLATITKELLY